MNPLSLVVRKIDKAIAESVVANKHYSRRIGIFWEAFGLYENDVLIGVCCFGQPSPAIQKHAFKDRDFRLYELTRLVVDEGRKNAASILISRSLKMLKEKPCAIVSYADSQHGHTGVVYQATNWIYTGATISHDKLYLVNGEKLHPMTVRDRYGVTKLSEWAAENKIQTVRPSQKHRYFFFTGSRSKVKAMKSKLAYQEQSYPVNSDKSLYDSGEYNCEHYASKHTKGN